MKVSPVRVKQVCDRLKEAVVKKSRLALAAFCGSGILLFCERAFAAPWHPDLSGRVAEFVSYRAAVILQSLLALFRAMLASPVVVAVFVAGVSLCLFALLFGVRQGGSTRR